MREDTPKMYEKGSIAIAIVVIGEKSEFLLGGKATPLLGSRLY